MPKYKKNHNDKFILDACCGPRYMWVNKKHPNTLYIDIRIEKKGYFPYRKNLSIQPDMQIDFTDMPFEDETFKLVIFDPPHGISNSKNINIYRIFSALDPVNWRSTLKRGFDECWRVLEYNGLLMFKWNEISKSYKEVLKVIGRTPLIYNTIGNKNQTYWACFMKLPKEYQDQEFLE